jgi:hypothetical protein
MSSVISLWLSFSVSFVRSFNRVLSLLRCIDMSGVCSPPHHLILKTPFFHRKKNLWLYTTVVLLTMDVVTSEIC